MTVPREIAAEIARLFHAEHWKIGTIARQLGVHKDVVRRVLHRESAERPTKAETRPPPSGVAPYLDFIQETLGRYPSLRSSRLCDMLRERGYRGSPRSLRRFVKTIRPVSVNAPAGWSISGRVRAVWVMIGIAPERVWDQRVRWVPRT